MNEPLNKIKGGFRWLYIGGGGVQMALLYRGGGFSDGSIWGVRWLYIVFVWP